jgi:hypothetical protein
MDSIFVIGQIVSVVVLCCGAALSLFAAGTGLSDASAPRYPAD